MKIQLRQQPFYLKLACVLVSLLVLGYITVAGKQLLSPLIFACLFSILLLPVCRFFENRCRFSRGPAAMTSVVLLLAAVSGLMYILGSQLSALGSDWPMFKQQLSSSVDDLQLLIAHKFHINTSKQLHYINDATNKIVSSGTVMLGATLLSVSSLLIFFVFIFIYSFFFLFYRSLILKFFVQVFREENSAMVYEIVKQVQFIIRKYIIGLLIEMAIVAVFIATVFSIMGVKYAILLGLITGLFNIIPYIGIFTALLVSALITFATAAAVGKVIWVVIVVICTHLVDSNVLLPVVVGSKVRINAMITVLGVVAGEMMWGLSGMFLSIPIIAVLKIIFDRVESLKPWGLILGDEHRIKKGKGGRMKLAEEPSLENQPAEKPAPDQR